MEQICSIESAIYQQLIQAGSCSLDELAAVDRLTREGTVTLTHPAPFCYLLSLVPREPANTRHVMQT